MSLNGQIVRKIAQAPCVLAIIGAEANSIVQMILFCAASDHKGRRFLCRAGRESHLRD